MMSDLHENYDDEIDLRELFSVLWESKTTIMVITVMAALLSVVISLSMPNKYKSETLLAPAGDDGGGGLAGLAGQFGGLASLAGVSLGGGGATDKATYALEVIESRQFVSRFVAKYDLKPALMAVDYWDRQSGALVFDDDVYDPKTKKWLSDEEPSDQEVHEAYLAALTISQDAATGFVSLGFLHLSPVFAKQITEWAVADLNEAMRQKDIAEAESSIAYLQQQIQATSLAELRKVFYSLIQAQTETMMLAKVRAEYVFETLDPAVVPEEKSEPKRAIICILGTLLGGMLSVLFVLVRHYWQKQED